ncbi:MAG: AbrB/MazE/SpoVT family DNA-binding domain-containing protein [Planctomycetes bacterium]|nr:AbrB/MazE/SpoVT family DNA-binding domain-containing protein [Planctomycetota bacterium]
MPHSTVTDKGQTTIPGEVLAALHIQAGDRLEYTVEGDRASIRVLTGLSALKGALPSQLGAKLSFEQIREQAAQNAAGSRRSKR